MWYDKRNEYLFESIVKFELSSSSHWRTETIFCLRVLLNLNYLHLADEAIGRVLCLRVLLNLNYLHPPSPYLILVFGLRVLLNLNYLHPKLIDFVPLAGLRVLLNLNYLHQLSTMLRRYSV